MRTYKLEDYAVGINVNDSEMPWTDMILDGKKTIETRNSNSLRPYVGLIVGIIRTGKGKAQLVGFVKLGEPVVYKTAEEFARDGYKHRVPNTSVYAFPEGGVKYGYPLSSPVRINPIEINSRGYVARYIGDITNNGNSF